MPKYDQYQSRKPVEDKNEKVHPIWRGIGCVMVVVIPFLAYSAVFYIFNNRINFPWFTIPQEIVFPTIKDPYLLVKILYTIIFAFVLYLIMGIITFVINKFFGPSKKGPYDIKP